MKSKKVIALLLSMSFLTACSLSGENELDLSSINNSATDESSEAEDIDDSSSNEAKANDSSSEETSESDSDDSATDDSEDSLYATRDKAIQEDPDFDGNLPILVADEDEQRVYGEDSSNIFTYYNLYYVSEESADLFPEFAKAIKSDADAQKEYLEGLIEDFGDGEGFPSYSSYGRYDWLKRTDAHYVSILRSNSDDDGQNSSYTYTAITYDVQTGKEIALDDVISDSSSLESFLIKEAESLAEFFEADLASEYEKTIHDAIEKNTLVWTLDENGVTFVFQDDIILEKKCYLTVPYDNLLVDEAYLPYSGQEFVSELAIQNLDYCNLNVKPTKNIEEFLPVFSQDEEINEIYVDAIKTLESTGYLPNGEYCYGNDNGSYEQDKEMSYEDSVAAIDLTGDREKELLICINGAYTSTISEWIFSYDREKKEFVQLFVNFDFQCYEGGILKCRYSHGGMYEDDFWPYDLYKYNEKTGEYDFIASVDSKQLLHDYETGELDDEMNEDFLYDEDTDDNGKYYIIATDDETTYMDDSKFEEWEAGYLSTPLNTKWYTIPKFAVIS